MPHPYPNLRRLAVALVVVTYGLLVFGATVRVHGAGLACPDWPQCFGQMVPPLDFAVGLEFGHRVLAGIVSLAFLALGVGILRDGGLRRRIGWLWGVALGVLALQIVLGGLTVLELLAEWTVTSHLTAGNAFCLLLLLLALRIHESGRPVERPAVHGVQRWAASLLAVLVVAQLAMGGLVSSSEAGLACGTWPGCNGAAWFPTFEGLIGLQVTHRLLGYLVLGGALLAVAATRGRGRTGRAALVVLGLVVVQIALGVANVFLHLPVEVRLLHSGGADAIVLATTWLVYESWSAPVRVASTAAAAELGLVEAK